MMMTGCDARKVQRTNMINMSNLLRAAGDASRARLPLATQLLRAPPTHASPRQMQ